MARLEMICVEPCSNDRDSWYRVHTVRAGVHHTSELAIPLARRVLPRLWAFYNLPPAGMFTGTPGVLPFPMGERYDGRRIVDIVDTDPADDYQPSLYQLEDGELVWIPAEHFAAR